MLSDILTTLAKGDVGDILGVIAILIFTVLGWMVQWIKRRKERAEKQAKKNVHAPEMESGEAFEAGGPKPPPPVAKPLPVGRPQIERGRPRRKPRVSGQEGSSPAVPQPSGPPPVVIVPSEPGRPQPTASRAVLGPGTVTPASRGRPTRWVRPRPVMATKPGPTPIPIPVLATDTAYERIQPSRIDRLRLGIVTSPTALRRAIVMAEILGPPMGLRDLSGHERGLHV